MSSRPAVAVLGQGIAGTLVSMRLREHGVSHVVVDRGHARASSYAAAGLVNPVTGRRFVLVTGFEAYVARFGIYERLGGLLGRDYVKPLTIYRDLSRVKDRNQWDLRRCTPAYAPYLCPPVRAADAPLTIADGERWLGPTQGAYRVDLPGLIADYRERLKAEGALLEVAVDTDRALYSDEVLSVRGQPYGTVVDCRGAACAKTEEWSDHPWRLSKGESIRFTLPTWSRDAATKLGGCFLAPIGDADDVWYGGTSTDHFTDEAPDPAVSARFLSEIDALLRTAPPPDASTSPPSTLNSSTLNSSPLNPHPSRAAVRPTTTDRRAIVEPHATIPGLYICNGLGTKGALTAPSVTAALWSMLEPRLLSRR